MSDEQLRRPSQWWRAEEYGLQPHELLGPVARRVRDQQRYRRDSYLHFIRSYAGTELTTLTMGGYSRAEHTGFSLRPKSLAFNVSSAVCNTAQAKIAKNRPVPQFLTQGGNWSQQRRAKNLSKFIEGEFYRCKVWEIAPLVVLDALVPGDGVVKVWRDDEQIYIDREFPWRVLEDDVEAQYGESGVRSRYQIKPYDRGVLMAMFPEHAEAIACATSDDDEAEWGVDTTADQLLVTEAWHLRSNKKANDGQRVVMINDLTLEVSPYLHDEFPFEWLRRNPPLMGTRAVGMVEEVDGIQQEINFTANQIQMAFRKNSGSHWSMRAGNKVHIEHLNNGWASILRFTGEKPELHQQTPIHPAMMEYLFSLIPKAFEMSGVSQMSATSQKPAGLDSGAAIREYNDNETERFVVFAKAFEDFFLGLARKIITLARELAGLNPEYAVNSPSRNSVKRIKFKDVDLDDDAYVMQCFPTSMLSKTPAGRLAMVGDLAKAGWITPQQAKRLLDMPDLERLNDLESASHELIEQLIERMLEEGKYESPEPMMDLVDAAHTTQMAYLRAKIDGAPPENLNLLLDFLKECQYLIAQMTPEPAPAPMPGPMGGPPMPGMPPPAPIEATGMYGPGAGPPPMPPLPVAA